MNANELADWLDNYAADSYCHEFALSATKLRQQQSEIDEWKYLAERLNSELKKQDVQIEALRKERKSLCVFCENRELNLPAKTQDEGYEVVFDGEKYTTKLKEPAKALTDEEIKQIFQEQTGFFFDDNPADDLALMDFARAILRKAQEK